MRIRTALIGFALATVAVVGTATGASADGIGGYGAKYHDNSGSATLGHGYASLSWNDEGGSKGGFGTWSD